MTKTKVLLFQFLIGRLKTKYFQQQKISAAKFQFLIGRLKTLHRLYKLLGGKEVSIPYR